MGVQGDGRTYSYAAALSSKAKADDLKLDKIDWQKLEKLARAIPKTIHQINRVVFLFGETVSESPRTITPTHLVPEVIEQLRQADAIVNQTLLKYDLLRSLSQVPVVLFPVNFGQKGARSIAIRTFITNDFMTGVPALPGREMPLKALKEMVNRILAEVPAVARVAYDLTSKPPGTTEWE